MSRPLFSCEFGGLLFCLVTTARKQNKQTKNKNITRQCIVDTRRYEMVDICSSELYTYFMCEYYHCSCLAISLLGWGCNFKRFQFYAIIVRWWCHTYFWCVARALQSLHSHDSKAFIRKRAIVFVYSVCNTVWFYTHGSRSRAPARSGLSYGIRRNLDVYQQLD